MYYLNLNRFVGIKNMTKTFSASLVDVYVGLRIKMIRKDRGITLEQMAEALDVTFQQVQKYEKGENRLSCGKLYEISLFFSVDQNFFFQGYAGGKTDNDNQSIMYLTDNSKDNTPPKKTKEEEKIAKAAVERLLNIKDKRIRDNIISLIELLNKK